MSRKTPWAVLLCKFKDDQSGFAVINKQDLVTLFTAPDVENVVTYWQDVSYGELDLTGSEVFGWLTLNKNQQEYQGSGANPAGRRELVEWAKQAATDAGISLDRHYGVIVYMSTSTDLWGSTGVVVCDVNSVLSHILQEVGHGYGLMFHSRAVSKPEDYQDPFCIMSSMTFGGRDPTFQTKFGASGPGLCSPYVFKMGWLSESRIARVPTNGRSPTSTELILSPLGERRPSHPQVAIFSLNSPLEVTYFVEYRYGDSGGWDRGLAQNSVVIHQVRSDGIAYFAGGTATSLAFTGGGFTGEVVEDPEVPYGQPYVDSIFDLSVEVLYIFNDGTVKIRIAPRAAVQTLSLREVARTKLGINTGFSVRDQVMQNRRVSLRERLVELLGQ